VISVKRSTFTRQGGTEHPLDKDQLWLEDELYEVAVEWLPLEVREGLRSGTARVLSELISQD